MIRTMLQKIRRCKLTVTDIGKDLGYTAQELNRILVAENVVFKKKHETYKVKYRHLFDSGDWVIVRGEEKDGKGRARFSLSGSEIIKGIVLASDTHKSQVDEKNTFARRGSVFATHVVDLKYAIKKDEVKGEEVKAICEYIKNNYKGLKTQIEKYNPNKVGFFAENEKDNMPLAHALKYVKTKKIRKTIAAAGFELFEGDLARYTEKAQAKSKKKKSGKDDFKDLMSIIRSGKKLKATQKDDGTISIFM